MMFERTKRFFARDQKPTEPEKQGLDESAYYRNGVQRAFSNANYGYGGDTDAIGNTRISGQRIFTDDFLEGLYLNTWSAPKIIDLIVDDVFSPGIVWDNEDEAAVETMEMQFEKFDVMHKVPKTIKAGRLFGTALLIMAPKSQNFMDPIDPMQVKKDDITHLIVVQKRELEVFRVHGDPRYPNYGDIYSYRWTINPDGKMPIPEEMQRAAGRQYQIEVHASRCLRFDGIKPPTDTGWLSPAVDDRRWGISILTRVYDDIVQDLIMNAGAAEAVNRSCVPIFRIKDFRDVLARGPRGDAISPEEYAARMKSSINNNKAIFADKNDEIDKLEVNMTGMVETVQNQTDRLAMIAGVPVSRFKGESATGLNANGEGDARDWRISVEGYRKEAIDDEWNRLMQILARNAGLSEPPEWEWGQLGEMNALENAEVLEKLSNATKAVIEAGIAGEEEMRPILNTSPLVDLPDELPLPLLEVKELQVEGMRAALEPDPEPNDEQENENS